MTPQKYHEIYHLSQHPNYFLVSGKSSQRRQLMGQSLSYNSHIAPHYSTTPMVATADALTTASDLWMQSLHNFTGKSGHGSPLSVQSDSIHTLSGDSLQGFTAANCLSEAMQDTTDTNPIAFPFLHEANNPATATINITSSDNYTFLAIVHPSLSRADVSRYARNPFEYQLQWIELPQPLFNGSSIGAIIFPPKSVNSTSGLDTSQSMILCNLAAGWGTTILQTEEDNTSGDSSVSSKISSYKHGSPTYVINGIPIPENADAVLDWAYPGYP